MCDCGGMGSSFAIFEINLLHQLELYNELTYRSDYRFNDLIHQTTRELVNVTHN